VHHTAKNEGIRGECHSNGGTAGLVAAVKLARVESSELMSRSPRVRSAISDSVTIARMVIEAAKKNA
jgi:hypothetical protein